MPISVRPGGTDAPPDEIVTSLTPTLPSVGGIVILSGTQFVRGKRRIGWRGYASILDKQDPGSPVKRSIRTSIAFGLIPKAVADGIRSTASSLTRFTPIPGITNRSVKILGEGHNALTRSYYWTKKNQFQEEMDAIDAEQLLAHPDVGPEFYDLDLQHSDPRHAPHPVQPSDETLKSWRDAAASSRKRGQPSPREMATRLAQQRR